MIVNEIFQLAGLETWIVYAPPRTPGILDMVAAADRAIMETINRVARKSYVFDQVIRSVLNRDLLKGSVLVGLWWLLWFRVSPDRDTRRRGLIKSFYAAMVATAVARAMQVFLPGRPRPLHDAELSFVPPYGISVNDMRDWSSFPSDHSVLFFALCAAIWIGSRGLGLVAFVWTLVVITGVRVYVGYHYPSDILVGAVFGVLIVFLAHRVPTPRILVEAPLRWAETRRGLFYGTAFVLTVQVATIFDDVRRLGSSAANIFRAVAAGHY